MYKIKQLGELNAPMLVFGGCYSNLQATIKMKNVAEQLQIPAKHIICTGDIVAYCAEPSETLEIIRDWGVHVVMGNCEESIAKAAPDCGCGFEGNSTCSLLSVGWYRYALSEVSDSQRLWMQQLPSRIDFSHHKFNIAVIHGGANQINRFIFPSTSVTEIDNEICSAGTDIVIGGHSGIPFGCKVNSGIWLNSGAIGMPANDGTRDGWYLLLEPSEGKVNVSWHRLPYDAEQSSAAMQAKGLTGGYEQTLLDGRWPSMDILPEVEQQQQGIPLTIAPFCL